MIKHTKMVSVLGLCAALACSMAAQSGRVWLPMIHGEVPLYPRWAWQANISGAVTLRLVISNGRVTSVKVVSSANPILERAAVENVRTWRFDVLKRPVITNTEFEYSIKGRPVWPLGPPRIYLRIPYKVVITVRPPKPTCSDCEDVPFTISRAHALPPRSSPATPRVPK